MSSNFDGIKTRKFGIEIEMTGLTRSQAAKAMANVLDGRVEHEGGSYDKYIVTDSKNRKWAIVYDGSINCYNANGDHASKSYSVELNSPVLGYEDIPLLQEVVRALRRAGGVTGPRYCAGTHIHISADDYTPQQIRNLVNIFASKEDFLWDALQVSTARESYCHKMDKQFIENKKVFYRIYIQTLCWKQPFVAPFTARYSQPINASSGKNAKLSKSWTGVLEPSIWA